jgi:hypothetical protein
LDQVVSTRIPVNATIRRTIVAKIAMAARPKLAGLTAGRVVAGVEDSADTVVFRALRWRLV